MTGRQGEPRRDAPEREELQKVMARWAKLPVPVAPSAVVDQRRARGAVTLRAAIGSAGRERQTRRMRFLSVGAAALALAIWGGFERFSAGSAGAQRNGHESAAAHPVAPGELRGRALLHGPGEVSRNLGGWQPVQAGHTVGEGDRVRALQRSVDVHLDRITSARVAPGSVLAITTLQAHLQELRLESGATAFEVDPSRAAEVVVHTANARIRVTGTAFSVTSSGTGAEAWSEVLVQQGRVEIASGGETVSLRPGQSWSSRDIDASGNPKARANRARATTAPRPPAPTLAGGVSADGIHTDRGDEVRGGKPDAEPVESGDGLPTTLSEENRLLRRALSARNAGNGARCVALLSELLTKFPESPLRQEAVVGQLRCLVLSGDEARAHRTAARYLSEYPTGFARDEARELVVGTAP
jgi:hypothetical protein